MSSLGRDLPLYRSAELRLAAAAAIAAGALLLAALQVTARWSDFLMLDFRQWQPSSSVPDLAGPRAKEYFESLQTSIPEQRPFRLSLQVPPTARPGDFVAVERTFAVGTDGRYCLRALTFGSPPAPGTTATTTPAFARVLVNGKVVTLQPIVPGGPGGAFYVGQIEPRKAKVEIRFEAVAEALAPGAPQHPPAAFHFEFATLRRCDPGT
jgi:hypothetical protein